MTNHLKTAVVHVTKVRSGLLLQEDLSDTVPSISNLCLAEIENGCIAEAIYIDQLSNVPCGEKCENFCELMTTNQQNCLSVCNFDEFCEEESGSNQEIDQSETESISFTDQDAMDGTDEESDSAASAESSGSGSNDESSDEASSDFESENNSDSAEDYDLGSDTTTSNSDNDQEDEFDVTVEETDSSDEEGSASEEQYSPGSDFIWATGSEWEATIEDLSYYGEGCENGRCHGGETNSSFDIDEWLIQHAHHPYDYTIDKICWIRQNFQKFHLIFYWLTSNSEVNQSI